LFDTKILVSGCGITYGRQKVKTWVNILELAGCKVLDASGPAVSNQWIINKAFVKLQQHDDIKTVILQLTNLGKLEVEVDQARITELVIPDPFRNFVIDKNFQVRSKNQIEDFGIWPSSVSNHHESKKHWYKWLFSPTLEAEDLYCKLMLLNSYCNQHNVKLCVYQGYDIDWTDQQYNQLQHMIKNIDNNFYTTYLHSLHYSNHDHTDHNSVPCLGYQFEIASLVSQELPLPVQEKVAKFKLAYDKTR